MSEESEIEKLKAEIKRLRLENTKMKGWISHPFFIPDKKFAAEHEYLGGGMWKKKKKEVE